MEKILIALDGSEHSMKALEEGKRIAEALKSTIVLVYVADTPMTSHLAERAYINKLNTLLTEQGKEIIERAMQEFEDFTGKIHSVIQIGDPADVIVKTAHEEKVDLIVMGSRGLSGIRRLMIGSVSHKVLNTSDVSVFIVK